MQLYKLSAYEIKNLLNKKAISSQEVTAAFLEQIHSINSQIKAFITITDEQAIQVAKESDSRRQNNNLLSEWDGVPVAIKDNISTEGILTSCGSRILENYKPPYDAAVVGNIKNAGLPVLGKTNLDEFAMGSSTETSYFGKTSNPVNVDKVPGGSSGGSAAAVAALATPWSLGSDTGGSIRQPASFCGVVGLKPTYGLVSRYGLVAFASSLDQIGPLASTVEDTAGLLQLIAGYDCKDTTSLKVEIPNYANCLIEDVKDLTVGIPKEYFSDDLDDEIKETVLASVRKLEVAGANIKEVSLPMTEYAIEAYYIIAPAEASSNLARYDGVRYGYRAKGETALSMFRNTRSQGFGSEVKRRIMLGTYALSAGYYDAYYRKAQQIRTIMLQEVDKVFKEVDVLATPTSPVTAFGFGEKKTPMEMYLTDIYTVTVNLTGVPAISIPCGEDSQGLPIGLQLIGKHFAEETILQTAYTLEKMLEQKEEYYG